MIRTSTFKEFVELVSKMDPIEYCALCRILCVELYGEDKEPRTFEVTFEEVMDSFLKMKKKPRKQLMATLRAGLGGDE